MLAYFCLLCLMLCIPWGAHGSGKDEMSGKLQYTISFAWQENSSNAHSLRKEKQMVLLSDPMLSRQERQLDFMVTYLPGGSAVKAIWESGWFLRKAGGFAVYWRRNITTGVYAGACKAVCLAAHTAVRFVPGKIAGSFLAKR